MLNPHCCWLNPMKSRFSWINVEYHRCFGDNNGFQKTASRQETGEIWIRLVNASPVAPSHLAVCPAPCKASRKKHGGINSQVEPRGYARGCIPNIWLSMVQYLYFRILKFHEISIDENKGVQPIHIIYSYIYIYSVVNPKKIQKSWITILVIFYELISFWRLL